MTIRWPLEVLPPRNLAFDIAPRTLSGPSAASGYTQVAASSAGIWKVTYDQIPVLASQSVLCFRAISALLEGRLNAILLPIYRRYQPVPDESDDLYDPVPHSDGAFFSDGSGYVGRVIDVQLSTAIVKGATSTSIAINVAGLIQPGQNFSIGERLHRLKSVVYTSETTADIKFTPPARDAASVGDNLEFDDPVVRVRLASDSEMDLPLEYDRWAFPAVNFLEDL